MIQDPPIFEEKESEIAENLPAEFEYDRTLLEANQFYQAHISSNPDQMRLRQEAQDELFPLMENVIKKINDLYDTFFSTEDHRISSDSIYELISVYESYDSRLKQYCHQFKDDQVWGPNETAELFEWIFSIEENPMTGVTIKACTVFGAQPHEAQQFESLRPVINQLSLEQIQELKTAGNVSSDTDALGFLGKIFSMLKSNRDQPAPNQDETEPRLSDEDVDTANEQTSTIEKLISTLIIWYGSAYQVLSSTSNNDLFDTPGNNTSEKIDEEDKEESPPLNSPLLSREEFLSKQSNLVLATVGLTCLMYDMIALSTMSNTLQQYPIIEKLHILNPDNPALQKYGITRILLHLNQFVLTWSALHYAFTIAIAAYGLYFILQRKQDSLRVGIVTSVATILFLAMIGFNEIYLSTSLNQAILSKAYINQSLVVGSISFLCSIFILYKLWQSSRDGKLNLATKVSLLVLLMGFLSLTSTSFIGLLHQRNIILLLAPLNIALVSIPIGIGLMIYGIKKKSEIGLSNRFLLGLIAVSLIGLGSMGIYWAFHPTHWNDIGTQINMIVTNYSIFFYAGLATLFTLYHVYHLAYSISKLKYKSEEEIIGQHLFNIFSSLMTVGMDLLFLYFCVYPLVCIGIVKLSMPRPLTFKNILNNFALFKSSLNQFGYLGSQQTQTAVFVLSILLVVRLLCPFIIPTLIKIIIKGVKWCFPSLSQWLPENNLYISAAQLDRKNKPAARALSTLIAGILIGSIGLVADKLVWNFNLSNQAAYDTFLGSIGVVFATFIISLCLQKQESDVDDVSTTISPDQLQSQFTVIKTREDGSLYARNNSDGELYVVKPHSNQHEEPISDRKIDNRLSSVAEVSSMAEKPLSQSDFLVTSQVSHGSLL